MHPLTHTDRENTAHLVREYLEGKYRLGKQHLPSLLGIEHKVVSKNVNTKDQKEDTLLI